MLLVEQVDACTVSPILIFIATTYNKVEAQDCVGLHSMDEK
jgi:hypothetical protein